MAWKIEFNEPAKKRAGKPGQGGCKTYPAFLRERLAMLDDPRSIGEALKGSRLGTFWKYRVGDYRVIASIEDAAVCVLVVKIGN